MRFGRSMAAGCILLLAIPSWGKQPPQASSTTQSTSDPQAVAVVQAAIAALGGATAISQSQSWDFQGLADGPLGSGNTNDTIKFQLVNPTIVVNGVSRPTPRFVTPSLFLPVLTGAILQQESQSSNYIMRYGGPSTIGSTPIIEVMFLDTNSLGVAQIWVFNTSTSLPVRTLFKLSAQLGNTKTFLGLVELSSYSAISGVLYPMKVVTYSDDRLPETLIIQTVTPNTPAPPSEAVSATGGVR